MREIQLTRGYVALVDDAALAYDKAAREHFGEFANCNFPPKKPSGVDTSFEYGYPDTKARVFALVPSTAGLGGAKWAKALTEKENGNVNVF